MRRKVKQWIITPTGEEARTLRKGEVGFNEDGNIVALSGCASLCDYRPCTVDYVYTDAPEKPSAVCDRVDLREMMRREEFRLPSIVSFVFHRFIDALEVAEKERGDIRVQIGLRAADIYNLRQHHKATCATAGEERDALREELNLLMRWVVGTDSNIENDLHIFAVLRALVEARPVKDGERGK